MKMDTEAMVQAFVPYKTVVEMRQSLPDDRFSYNEWVWSGIVDTKKISRKSRSFRFHHEMMTDGVSVSLLYSRVVIDKDKNSGPRIDQECAARQLSAPNELPGRAVGLDPGKKNLASMTDENGVSLRYSLRQRNFESKLSRYREILSLEKKRAGVDALETKLSLCPNGSRTNDHEGFLTYLKEKREFDRKAGEFYRQEKWRSWRFRIFVNRKKSEDGFLNRIESTYGKDATIYYGDWSRKDQMKGCDPSPTVGLRKLLKKSSRVVEVDEFRTSKMCNGCMGELCKYRKRNGRLSYTPDSVAQTADVQRTDPSGL